MLSNVLDILLQSHRDKAAAKKFLRKLLKQQDFAPRVLITDEYYQVMHQRFESWQQVTCVFPMPA